MPILRENYFKSDKYYSVQNKKEEWLNPAILRDTAILLTHYFERTERDSNIFKELFSPIYSRLYSSCGINEWNRKVLIEK